MTTRFVGRTRELEELNSLLNRQSASLVVIRGRRRIGKSRLVQEFAKNKQFYEFSGPPPTNETSEQSQREEFARQLGEQFGLPGLKATDWGDLFTLLAKQTFSKEHVVILLDEISWMGSKDPEFLGKLKIAWDIHFSKNPKLILVLCGSVSSWIEKNILSSTGFFGRITHQITLEELSLPECHNFLEMLGSRWSISEEFMLLSLTGGIPWYIELVNPKYPALENIKQLCFEKDGIFVDEFKKIFNDLFGRRGEICKKIVEALVKGPLEYSEISEIINYPSGGPLSDYLNDLLVSGFISRDNIWDFISGKESKIFRYRLRDNYLHFYLRYIMPNLAKIIKGNYKNISISSLPGWESIMGLQFEKLVLNNRHLVHEKLKIESVDVVYDNPYFQRTTKKTKGVQIDYLIQIRSKSLIACEIKFSKQPIRIGIVNEMKEKIKKLSLPRGFSCCPVLISAGEVHSSVEETDYFTKIINFDDLLLGK